MTVGANGHERLRIAITSPDILAQIRQVFAGKNLVVDIVGMPYVEVAVRPAGHGARKPAGTGSHTGTGTASANDSVSPRPLRAEYRLSVLPVGEKPDPVRVAKNADSELTLSSRQREVMALMSRGARNAEIAETLHVTEKTVKNHINRIFREMGVDGRVEAVLRWQRYQAEVAGPEKAREQTARAQ